MRVRAEPLGLSFHDVFLISGVYEEGGLGLGGAGLRPVPGGVLPVSVYAG